MKNLKGKGKLLLGSLFLLLLTTSFCPEPFVVLRRSFSIPSLAKEHEDLNIVFLSDLHLRTDSIESDFYSKIISAVNRQNPDLILISGDLLDRSLKNRLHEIREQLSRFVSRLKSRHGIFAVTGNHENYCGRTQVRALFRDAGIQLLEDEVVHIQIHGKDLPIMGISERVWFRNALPRHLAERLRRDPVPLVLVHRPDAWLQMDSSTPSLVLAGHTHGGLLRLPFLDSGVYGFIRVEPHQQIYKELLYGHFRKDQKQLFVSSGVDGSFYYFRVNCPPEIIVLQLQKESDKNLTI